MKYPVYFCWLFTFVFNSIINPFVTLQNLLRSVPSVCYPVPDVREQKCHPENQEQKKKTLKYYYQIFHNKNLLIFS